MKTMNNAKRGAVSNGAAFKFDLRLIGATQTQLRYVAKRKACLRNVYNQLTKQKY